MQNMQYSSDTNQFVMLRKPSDSVSVRPSLKNASNLSYKFELQVVFVPMANKSHWFPLFERPMDFAIIDLCYLIDMVCKFLTAY